MNDIAIKIENLKKEYKLGAIGGSTLRAEFESWWAKKTGKEDPNTKIGESTINYGKKFLALDGINLTIKKGEAVGIIGGNGAGKSTLLKILSRITAPTEGDVWIDGRIASMLEVGTGFHGELTGRENIYMNGAILGMTKKEVDAKIESIIDFSECRQFIDTPVKRYSSGMYVKLAFAVASHLDAEIMIMDEVLAVGDMAFQKKCLGKMGDEAKGGKTVLYVSHNMATIRNLCTRVIVLNKGKVVFDGDVEKGIGVYLGSSSDVKKTSFNKEDLKWDSINKNLGTICSFESLKLLNKEYPLYSSDEQLVLEIKYKLKQDIKSLNLSIQLYSYDRTTIGFWSERINKVHMGDNISRFKLDLNNLATGLYCFRLTLHSIDDRNNFIENYDEINYIYFEVTNPPNELVWRKDWWNNIRLNSFKEL